MDEKLLKKLALLENYNVFLYDDGAKLYFLDTEREKIIGLFYEKGQKLKEKLEKFCDNYISKLG